MAAVSLGSNINSLRAQTSLNRATAKLAASSERLASGSRINHAADDAAGLAIASSLKANSRVFGQAIRNVNDGVSAANIAEGALAALQTISQRQIELAEQAANGTYSLVQRQALNSESNKLVDEFNRIVGGVRFNGTSLLDPALSSVVVQAGYGSSGTLQAGFSDKLRRAIGDGTFSSSLTLVIDSCAFNLTTADFNGDGLADIASSDVNAGILHISISNGDGTFATSATSAIGDRYIVSADFNGDGRADLAVGGSVGTAAVALGRGDGTFGLWRAFGAGGAVTTMTTGDFNGDKITDLAVTNENNAVVTLLGNGNGTFKALVTAVAGLGSALSVASGDFDGDGRLDLAVTDYGATGVSVLLGNGNGTFRQTSTIAASTGMKSVSIGDFNGDGRMDLFAAGYASAVFLGNGNGTFRAAASIPSLGTGPAFHGIVGDFNGDGRDDLAAATYSFAASVGILFGNGDGTFKADVSTGDFSNGATIIAAGDMDGDGRLDLAVSNYFYGYTVKAMFGAGGFTSSSPYVNINTQAGARTALGTARGNLDRIQSQLGAIGALTSRLSSALNTLQSQNENVLAAASRIEDVDVASESAELTRHGILQRAGAAVLAQANLAPELALRLLRG